MTFAIRARRPLAIGVTLLLAASGLALSAPLSASASNTSQATAVENGLNSLRVKAGLPKLIDNKDIERLVQRYTEVYAKSGQAAAERDTKYSLPAGATAFIGPGTTLTNYSDSKAVTAIISRARSSALDSTYNYGSVGYYKKSSKTKVAFFFGVHYDSTPNKVLTVAGPTVPLAPRYGATSKVKFAVVPSKGTTLEYQWKVGGVVVSNTSAVKITSLDQIGKSVTVTVRATRAGYDTVIRTSKKGIVARGQFAAKTPAVSGKRVVGRTLIAKTGNWGSGVDKYGYQWLRNGKTIKGATKATYVQTKADRKKKIDVKVTAVGAGYNKASKASHTKTKTKK